MRVVLYTDDMEPITVIELTKFAYDYLVMYGRVRLPVVMPPNYTAFNPEEKIAFENDRIVEIFSETFIRKSQQHMMLFTRNEESALLLKCAFLPGQNKHIQDREKKAFATGFLYALSKVGRN